MYKFKLYLVFMLASFSLISCKQPKAINNSLDMPASVRENIDKEINKYNNNVVYKIIELRDYRFRKANIFCTHSNIEIEKSEFLPKHIDVIARLYCAELLKKESKKDSESTTLNSYSGFTNLSDTPIKYTISLFDQNKPSILGFQSPRNAPLYEHDFKLYFNQDERNKINSYKLNNEEINRKLKEKVRQSN